MNQLPCTCECRHCQILSGVLGDNRESKYLCRVDDVIDYQVCPYPDCREFWSGARKDPVMGLEDQTPEEKALDRVLELGERYLAAYCMGHKIRLLELTLQEGTSQARTADELAAKVRAMYEKLGK